MFWDDRYMLPDAPPALEETFRLSKDQRQAAEQIVSRLSAMLESLPILLSQQGEVICSAGLPGQEAGRHLAETVHRIWQKGARRHAREVLRFNMEVIEMGNERASFILYSAHVSGALTLTVGWQPSLSLTQLRSEAADAREQLIEILSR